MTYQSRSTQSVLSAAHLIKQARDAQKLLSQLSRQQINNIAEKMSRVAYDEAFRLADLAVLETRIGKITDKAAQNRLVCKAALQQSRDKNSIAIAGQSPGEKTADTLESVGVVVALISVTNPVSSTIYKAIIAIQSGNAIVFSPHPLAKKCTQEAVRVLQNAALAAGAPDGLLGCMTKLSPAGTKQLIKDKDTALVIASDCNALIEPAYHYKTAAITTGGETGPDGKAIAACPVSGHIEGEHLEKINKAVCDIHDNISQAA